MMRRVSFFKGIDFHNPNLTRDPRKWWRYLCWYISFWMMTNRPYYPMWLRRRLLKHYQQSRHSMTWRMVKWWKEVDPDYVVSPEFRPLPWYIGVCALGPFIKPWDTVQHWFGRQKGVGYSSRCEFTDRERGLLYGGPDEPFIEAAFERFIHEIDAEGDEANDPR